MPNTVLFTGVNVLASRKISKMTKNLKPVLFALAACTVVTLVACGGGSKEPTFQAPPELGPKFGFIDKTGKFVIKPQYRKAYSFSDDLAAVEVSSRWGYIDKDGKMIIERQYEDVNSFSHGYAGVKAFGSPKWMLIDKNGNATTQATFEKIGDCGDANKPLEPNNIVYCAYQEKGKWGFIATNGESKVEPKYDQVGPFSEGFAAVAQGGKWGYIDATGKPITDLKFTQAQPFHDRVAECWYGSDFVILDTIGTMSISDPLHSRDFFHDGRGLSLKKGKYGFMNEEGKIVIKRKFSYAEDFRDGLACVGVANNWRGYIDPTGNFAIPPVFNEAAGFEKGLALVKIDPRYVSDDGTISASALEEAAGRDPHAAKVSKDKEKDEAATTEPIDKTGDKAEAKTEDKAETKTEEKTETKTQTKTETKTDLKPQAKTEPESQPKK